jgi:ATP-dependent RNA helicase DHX37/DHR1
MAGPPVRERFNAKARGSTAGSGGHKKRKRPSAKARAEALGSDGDVEMKEPVKAAEPPAGAGMSSKKRKRMESYIVSWNACTTLHAKSIQLKLAG